MEIKFEDYRNLIWKQAHYYSKKTGVEFEELEAEGYLIFCEAVQKFDSSRSCKFSTYLYHSLRGLQIYAKKQSKANSYVDIADHPVICYDKFQELIEMYDCAASELDDDALEILCDFLEVDFVKSETAMKKYKRHSCNWGPNRSRRAIRRLRDWWHQDIISNRELKKVNKFGKICYV